MAISAASVWEVRSSATSGNVNGGFFVSGASGTDYSQQDAAQYSTSTATTSGAGAVILWAAAAADMVGNGLKIASGTNFTAGWYEIISVSAGVSVTVDRNCCTGAGSNGVIKVGGAMSLNSSDGAWINAVATSNTVWVKNGTYTVDSNLFGNIGAAQNPIKFYGYNSTRGDNPTNSNRPTLNFGAAQFNPYQGYWIVKNFIMTGTATEVFLLGTSSQLINCKVVNKSTNAGRAAISMATDSLVIGCEAISYRGQAIDYANGVISGCWIHSSDIGVRMPGTSAQLSFTNNIIESCVSYAFRISGANTVRQFINGNTFFGATNTEGVGVNFVSGVTDVALINNIITGFATGVSHADSQSIGYDDYNDYYNNDTNVSNWTLGSNSITLDPSFSSVSQVTGTTATTNGSVLTDSGKDFTALGVVAGRDYLHIKSGTGVTVGIYGISTVGTTTLTLDIAPGTDATADKVYQITIGKNFSPGTNMRGVGYPGSFPDGYTTGYIDIGAVQRKEKISTDPGATNVIASTGYTIDDNSYTGSYISPTATTVKIDTIYGNSYTGSYTGSDRWSDPGQNNVLTGISYLANAVTQTGQYIHPTTTTVKISTVYGVSYTGSYTGSDRWSDPGQNNVLTGISYLADAVTQTGQYIHPTTTTVKINTIYGVSYTGSYNGSDRWSDPGAANVLSATTYLANGVTQTGSYSPGAGLFSDPGIANVRSATNYLFSGVTLTGTLQVPSYTTGTAGTCDTNAIKELIRYVIDVSNTTTGAPIDLSNNMSTRVNSVLKLNPEKIMPQASLFPAVTVFLDSKKIEMKTIAASQVHGKRRADLTFKIVGLTWNDRTQDYRVDPSDNDLEYLMENVELILRSYANLSGNCLWQFPTGVSYHSGGYDEQTHFRVGILDLQVTVYY